MCALPLLSAVPVPPAAVPWLWAAALLALGAGLWAWDRARLRRRAAAAEASAAREHALFDGAGDPTFVHDVDGQGVTANRAARRLLGLADAGRAPALLDAVAVADRAAAREHLAALARDGRARTDLQFAQPGGDARLLDVVSTVVDGADGPRAVSVGRDVGASRRREASLVAARDRAREHVRQRNAFMASLSHAVRTPLTAVIGFAEILHDEVAPETRGLVTAIEAGGRRLLQTLSNVFDLARLDAGAQTLRPADVDVVERVRRAAGRVRGRAEERGLRLHVQTTAEAVGARLDVGALDRVLETLVGNAVSFTERGGVTVEVVDTADDVTIRVLDTGPGIAPDVLPDLFSEYRLRPATPEREEVGVTALGLAVVKRLVDLAGGSISVESQWGAGTAFTVVLPLRPAGADDPVVAADLVAPAARP